MRVDETVVIALTITEDSKNLSICEEILHAAAIEDPRTKREPAVVPMILSPPTNQLVLSIKR